MAQTAEHGCKRYHGGSGVVGSEAVYGAVFKHGCVRLARVVEAAGRTVSWWELSSSVGLWRSKPGATA